MNAFLKKNLSFVIMAGLLAAMGSIAWFGIAPLRGSIAEKRDEIQKFYTTRENRERQIAKLPELREQFETILADEKALDILLQENRIVDFVKTLEGLAAETGTRIVIKSKDGETAAKQKKALAAAAPTGKNEKKGIADNLPLDRYLHLEVALTGGYGDIVSFLSKMEALPLALDVIGVEMKIQEDDRDSRSPVSGSGVNPFLLTPQGSDAGTGSASPEAPAGNGNIEASFDTVIYLGTAE